MMADDDDIGHADFDFSAQTGRRPMPRFLRCLRGDGSCKRRSRARAIDSKPFFRHRMILPAVAPLKSGGGKCASSTLAAPEPREASATTGLHFSARAMPIFTPFIFRRYLARHAGRCSQRRQARARSRSQRCQERACAPPFLFLQDGQDGACYRFLDALIPGRRQYMPGQHAHRAYYFQRFMPRSAVERRSQRAFTPPKALRIMRRPYAPRGIC